MKHKIIEYSKEDFDKEEWLPIPDYENDYEVSNLGRVRSKIGKTTFTQIHGTRHWTQKILQYKNKNGDIKTGFRVDLWKKGKPKTILVARLVASAFIENQLFNKQMTINHIDGNRLNNRPENLEWCSLAENIRKGFETNLYFQIGIKLTNKKTNEEKTFRSLSQASSYIGKNAGYFSSLIKRGKFENSQYKWELIDHH